MATKPIDWTTMQTIGYYSLIQYCPNLWRMEAVNIGVILFVPEHGFMKARVKKNNDRIKKIFGPDSFDNKWLNAAKESMQERVNLCAADFRSLKDFQKFVDTRMNEILLTNPNPIKVDDPRQTLDSLFDELVDDKKEEQDHSPLIQELDEAFRKPELVDRIQFNAKVNVPGLNRTIRARYAYRNGLYNIVKPELFTEQKYIDKGSLLATEGRFIKLKSTEPMQLIVVPAVISDKKSNEILSTLHEIFDEQHVRVIWPGERQAFIQEVQEQAH